MITTAITNKISALPVTGAVETHQKLRLKLKPKAPTIGSVDGAWWPRSRDLAAELPALLAVLAVRLGPIERVGYHLGDWAPTVRRSASMVPSSTWAATAPSTRTRWTCSAPSFG
jgi:hypothetical protein